MGMMIKCMITLLFSLHTLLQTARCDNKVWNVLWSKDDGGFGGLADVDFNLMAI